MGSSVWVECKGIVANGRCVDCGVSPGTGTTHSRELPIGTDPRWHGVAAAPKSACCNASMRCTRCGAVIAGLRTADPAPTDPDAFVRKAMQAAVDAANGYGLDKATLDSILARLRAGGR